MHKPKIGIIGGGAAGLMAAATIKELEPNLDVVVFEKNAYLGAKVIISGGGRCNVTTGMTTDGTSPLSNNRHDIEKLLENYPRGGKFLMSAFFRFPPASVIDWFQSHKVPLKTEEDFRVFPVSNDGHDIVGALESTLTKANTEIHLNTTITHIEKLASPDDSHPLFRLHTRASGPVPLGEIGHHDVSALILTTGGNAYRHTGSTGDGYSFAKELGHTITNLAPSLSSYITIEKWPAKVSGVSFEKAELTLKTPTKTYTRTGAFLFTHKGVSGPAVFALSGMAAYDTPTNGNPLHLTINFFPEYTQKAFAEHFQQLANQHGAKTLFNFLDIFLPKSLCDVYIELLSKDAPIDPQLKASQIDKDLKTRILTLLQALPLTIINRTPGDEFVTAGGVPTSEVNTNTMESKIQPNLYFAGELLDIDGFTGGFNLQASWASGRLAGESAFAKLSL